MGFKGLLVFFDVLLLVIHNSVHVVKITLEAFADFQVHIRHSNIDDLFCGDISSFVFSMEQQNFVRNEVQLLVQSFGVLYCMPECTCNYWSYVLPSADLYCVGKRSTWWCQWPCHLSSISQLLIVYHSIISDFNFETWSSCTD